MLRLDKKQLLENKEIRKVQFEGEDYFSIEDVSKLLNEDLSEVIGLILPIDGEYKPTATIENIEKGRKQEELSDFNKALLKARKFKE
ncbi:hypothetical protein [uncultured Chryseobacterium sp.]|uniref:hypothetical protein n=1 Tax=uncultured Chryseobacterium sp. TaxID=259322 RepID=UPI0025D195CB|nr:hypothetical protein [uncultured Chryseobacterium sp.]